MKKEILRKHLVLRWDPSEIMSGYKTLPLGITMSLSKAVVEKSPVNIEIIVFLNGRFVEESNFFSLGQNLPDGKVKVLNGEQESYDNFNHFFIEELKKSIHKLLTSKLMFNPFKVIKRMFSLAKFTGDEASAAKLYPIIYSNISLLYQIKGDIKTLIKLLKSDNSFPMNYAMYELTNMKVRLSNVLQLSENFLEEFNNGIDNIVNNSNLPNEELIGRLEDLETPLEIIIDKEAVNFLKKNNLNV
jgi:hypothetical protein